MIRNLFIEITCIEIRCFHSGGNYMKLSFTHVIDMIGLGDKCHFPVSFHIYFYVRHMHIAGVPCIYPLPLIYVRNEMT